MAQRKPSTDDGKTQRQKFIEAAREAGASESEAVFDRALRRVASAPPQKPKKSATKKKKTRAG